MVAETYTHTESKALRGILELPEDAWPCSRNTDQCLQNAFRRYINRYIETWKDVMYAGFKDDSRGFNYSAHYRRSSFDASL